MGESVMLGGVRLDAVSLDTAVERTVAAAKAGACYPVVTPNATMLHRAFHDEGFSLLLSRAALALPDGIGAVWAAKYLKTPLPEGRIAGVDFGEALLARAARERVAVAFFGGREGIAERARERLIARYPRLSVVYCRNGYAFSPETVAGEIAESGATLLFVCLGSPLQEKVGAFLAERLSLPVVCLGGSLDIYAGALCRAPKVFRALGLEWLWRMLREPRRFRGVSTLFAFFCDVLRLKSAKKSCNRARRRL